MKRKEFLRELKSFGEKNNIPNISEKNAIYLREILRENKYSNILEIGSANGYSTIQFADEIEAWDGKITSIEFSQDAYESAQENYTISKVWHIIKHYFWDAREIIPLLEEKYDFIFIDGLKKASLDFYLLVKDILLKNGTIVIDDVILYRHKMENFYLHLEENNIPYTVIDIDDDDGIMVIKKES